MAKAGLVAKTLEAEKLKFELARLKRGAFGQSSERIDRKIEQLELKLEEIATAASDTVPSSEPECPSLSGPVEKKPRRKLPDHLARVTQIHEPSSCACPRCGTERLR